MKRFKTIVMGLALALGSTTACSTDETPDQPEVRGRGAGKADQATEGGGWTIVQDVEAEPLLAELRALDFVTVGHLWVALPDEATSCYLQACPGWETEVADEVARQLPRLEGLVAAATEIAAASDVGCAEARPDEAAIDDGLQTLRDLHIVEVGDLIHREPVAEAHCYNFVCPGEAERVAAENDARAALLVDLAASAAEL